MIDNQIYRGFDDSFSGAMSDQLAVHSRASSSWDDFRVFSEQLENVSVVLSFMAHELSNDGTALERSQPGIAPSQGHK
jgi:hypothetical protein